MNNRSPWWLKALAVIATLFALAVQAQGGVLTLRQVKGSAITNAEYDGNWVESYSAVAHGFSVGTLVYKSGASSWAKAIATASSTFADGVVVAVPDANTAYISVHFGQPFTKTAHGLGAAGTDVYLSDSVAGNMTASTTDQLIGQVLDANTVLFGAMGGGGGAGFSGSYTGAVTFDGDVATNLDVDNTHATDANFKNIFIGRREGNIRFFLNGTGLDEGEIGLRGPTGNDRWKCYHTTTASECDFKEADGTTSSSIGSILGSYSWNGRDVVGGSHYVYNSDGAELELTGTDVKVSAGADLLIADLTASECVATDSNKRLVSTGSPCGAGGGGDSITVNATAATDAKFIDGDIDWTINTGTTPDEISATVACTGCVDATDVAGLDAGDTTTGTFADARVDGSAEADELVLAGDVDGTANANDIDETAVEAELEGVLDLADLQEKDIDSLSGQSSWDTAATKKTADLVVDGVEVDFEAGAAEGYPRLAQSTTPPAGDCDAAGEAGRLYQDTDADTDGSIFFCRGAAGWKDIDDDGGAGGGDVNSVGDCASGDCFAGTADGGNALDFEGSTADGFETTVTAADPTADATITLPNTTGRVPIVLDAVGQLDIVNDATEQTLYSFSIPADALGTNRSLHLVVQADYFNNSAAGRSITLRIKYGATTLYDDATGSIPAAATRRAMPLIVDIGNTGTTNSQFMSGWWACSNTGSTTTGIGDFGSAPTCAPAFLAGTSAEDSTAAKTLTVTIQHSTNNVNLSYRRQFAQLTLY